MAAAAVVSTILLSPLSASSGAAVSEREVGGGYAHSVKRAFSPRGSVTGKKDLGASRSETCRSARTGLAWYRGRQRDWLKLRGAGQTGVTGSAHLSDSPRKPRNCADARYLAQVAKRRSFAARQAYERWQERRTLQDFAARAGSNAWLNAVEEVQRIYPGTSSWLISCSASEGGHGRWVPNSQGSGVGGWLQFYPSTFYRMFYAALADTKARGYHVPRAAASWYSTLGQALAGAWGVTHGRRHEWHGAGC